MKSNPYIQIFIFLVLLAGVVSAQEKHFRIAIDDDYAPFTFRNANGKPDGLLVDIWRLWAKENNYTVEFRFYDWKGTLEATRKGEVDFHSGTTPDYGWMVPSEPIYEIEAGFFVKHGAKIESLLGAKVGVIDPYYAQMVLTMCHQKCSVVLFDTYKELIDALQKQKIDVLMDDIDALSYFFIRHQLLSEFEEVRHLRPKNRNNLIAAVVRREKSDLILTIDAGLRRLKRADLLAIERRWLPAKERLFYQGSTANNHNQSLFFYLLIVGFVVVIGILVMLGWRLYRLRQMHQIATQEALIDPLTGVYNKRAFEQIEYAAVEHFSVLFVDVDYFKPFNDTYGHDKGDMVLRKVAQVLKDLKHPELHVYRVGGDEFVVVAHGLDLVQTALLCNSILQQVSQLSIEHHTSPFKKVSLTIGAAWSPIHADLKGALYRCADKALYVAKQKGRNCYELISYPDALCDRDAAGSQS